MVYVEVLLLADHQTDLETEFRHLESLRIEDEIERIEQEIKIMEKRWQELRLITSEKTSTYQSLQQIGLQIARQQEIEAILSRP
jgi:hypothetical protein